MKNRKLSAMKLFFLFATLGAFPFLYPAIQFQGQDMSQSHERSFKINLSDRMAPMTKKIALTPIDPILGSEVQPDPVE